MHIDGTKRQTQEQAALQVWRKDHSYDGVNSLLSFLLSWGGAPLWFGRPPLGWFSPLRQPCLEQLPSLHQSWHRLRLCRRTPKLHSQCTRCRSSLAVWWRRRVRAGRGRRWISLLGKVVEVFVFYYTLWFLSPLYRGAECATIPRQIKRLYFTASTRLDPPQ